MPTDEIALTVTEFSKRCRAVLSDIAAHRLEGVTLSRHGRAVARIGPVTASAATPSAPSLYGFMAGTVEIAEGVDLSRIGVLELLQDEGE
jgi:hypothetical protein